MSSTMDRHAFVRRGLALGGTLAAAGPLTAFYARSASGANVAAAGFGPLVDRGDLWLPEPFEYQILSVQGTTMSDGNPVPGIFDGMAAYPGTGGSTILIRNHENREQAGEINVVTPDALQYDAAMRGGNTKLVVRRRKRGGRSTAGTELFDYEVEREFAVLAGTSTNCAGGIRSPHWWLTCEEVVKRTGGIKHGYIFELDARADAPVPAIPITQLGRRAHEAALEHAGIIYATEDRGITTDPAVPAALLARGRKPQNGACLYRYSPSPRGGGIELYRTRGPLEALAIRGEFHANMDTGREVGSPFPVEWVPVPEPDHEDDTDARTDRQPGLTPNRVAAQDNGAAYFRRQEGAWAGRGRIFFDCTDGGPARLGQIWEYHPGRETLTLVYESSDAAKLASPDNVVVAPSTGDVLLCEDGSGEQFVRGVTPDGLIYDFAKTAANETEFAGACFDPDGKTLYLNQQGDRGNLPSGGVDRAVTYAIYGPFGERG